MQSRRMQSATQAPFRKDSWQSPRNARTLRAFMALRNQEIGQRLRELRGQKPQTTVADELGVAERTYQNWEAGDAKPSYRNLQRIAAYFGVGEDYILTGERRGAVPASTPDILPARRGDGEDRLARMEEALIGHAEHIEALLERQDDVLREIKTEQAALRDLIAEHRGLKEETDQVHRAIQDFLATFPPASATAPAATPQRSGRAKKKPAAAPGTR